MNIKKYIQFNFSQELLNGESTLANDLDTLGTQWTEAPLLNEYLEKIPDTVGFFMILFKQQLASSPNAPNLGNIIYADASHTTTLRSCFDAIMKAFENKDVLGTSCSPDILLFDYFRRSKQIVFCCLVTEVSREIIGVVLDKVKSLYSPPGNLTLKAKLDRAKIEPAF